jgi:hypothetical protein
MTLAVHSRDVVIRKVCGHGCARRMDLDLPASYAFTYADQKGVERLFFIPRELTADGYTITQLQEIEETLEYHGFDLLPLDPHLH